MSATQPACACGTCASCSGAAARPAVADPLVFAHGAIKARMLARIASVEIDGVRPLDRLSTRDSDDPAIALIDAFAEWISKGKAGVPKFRVSDRLIESGVVPSVVVPLK